MVSGRLSILPNAQGLDIININPEITFFKKIYKRHTNFGSQYLNVMDNQSNTITPKFGETIEIEIINTGSLISDMYMEFLLPCPVGSGGVNNNGESLNYRVADTGGIVTNFRNYAHWVNSVGYAIIDKIDFFIGDELIDSHIGLWFDIWNELTDSTKKNRGLVGKYDTSRFNYIEEDYTRYIVPLQFYFNRNPGLALPIFLIENIIKIKITFANVNSLLNYGYKDGTTAINSSTNVAFIDNFKLYVNYIFLEQAEKNLIRKNTPNNYLIETITILDYLTEDRLKNIDLSNPVKELIWVFRHNTRSNKTAVGSPTSSNYPGINFPGSVVNNTFPNDIFNYSKITNNTDTDDLFDPITNVSINITNELLIENLTSYYYRTIQPSNYHSNIPGGHTKNEKSRYIYIYSFALNPEDYQPSGTYNFSKNNDKLNLIFTGADFTNYRLTLFVLNYEYLYISTNTSKKQYIPYL
jgi:hypothetical protein